MSTHGRRRALGQHFLKDTFISNLIATTALEVAATSGCQGLLEIGPGKGAITRPLLEGMDKNPGTLKGFTLVEKDEALGRSWSVEQLLYKSVPLRVEVGDFLEVETSQWLSHSPLTVVSNLPYSSGTAILQVLARRFDAIPVMVLMFQAEVAKRLRAEPSTKDRGSLSLWIQNRWDVEKLLTVPPEAFIPAPQVFSEVVILRRRAQARIDLAPGDEILWEKFLKTSFSQRRKMLRTVLPWKNALELSGVDGKKRAEELVWDEWIRLFEHVRSEQ